MSVRLPPRQGNMLDYISDCRTIENLGAGAYSSVDLVECPKTKQRLALKKVDCLN